MKLAYGLSSSPRQVVNGKCKPEYPSVYTCVSSPVDWITSTARNHASMIVEEDFDCVHDQIDV